MKFLRPENDPAPNPRRRAVPLGLLGMVAIVIGFESFLARHDADFTELSAADWRMTRDAVAAEARDARVMAFGDSLLKFGLVPEVIARKTGLATFNLSLLGGQAASSYFMLRKAIEAGARPRAILLDCQDLPSVEGFDGRGLGLWHHLRSWPELLSIRDAWELAATARDADLLGATWIRALLPSIKARHEVALHLPRLIKSGTTKSRREAEAQRRNWRLNRGSILMAARSKNEPGLTRDQLDTPPSNWMLDPVTRQYLGKFLALAADHDIQVFWLIPPTSPEQEALKARVGQAGFFTRVARDLQAEFPGLVVIDGRSPGYGRSVFIDDSHLDRNGAVAFSDGVADVVARSLDAGPDGPRWVALPPYARRCDPGSIEDLGASRLAIDAERRFRR